MVDRSLIVGRLLGFDRVGEGEVLVFEGLKGGCVEVFWDVFCKRGEASREAKPGSIFPIVEEVISNSVSIDETMYFNII